MFLWNKIFFYEYVKLLIVFPFADRPVPYLYSINEKTLVY